jgi:hypothetical protein
MQFVALKRGLLKRTGGIYIKERGGGGGRALNTCHVVVAQNFY